MTAGTDQPGQNRRQFPRRNVLKAAGVGTTGAALVAAGIVGPREAAASAATMSATTSPAGGIHPRVVYTMPTLTFDDQANQSLLGTVYEAALTNVVGINTAYAVPATYNLANLVSYPPGNFLIAGQGYPLPQRWTRDASVNTWNAVSLLAPVVGRNTLWSVIDSQTGGGLIVQQGDNEWWDQIVWVVSAWDHFLVTGDQDFLGDAYTTAVNTMSTRVSANFNSSLGLFEGPGFMNDGISGYPEPPYEPGIASSFVLDYPYASVMMCLSTNCLYYGAYRAMAHMAALLGHASDATGYQQAAASLRTAINANFWRADAGTYGYLIHGTGDPDAGQLDTHQEGGGLALAVLLGVADAAQTALLLTNTQWEPHGVVNVWPDFPWYDDGTDDGKWGRQASLWPMVHSMFGHAAAIGGRADLFGRAVTDLAEMVNASQVSFYELYNPVTGVPDGGWQPGADGSEITQWTAQPDQTWSATGYLRMIYRGLFGLTFTTRGLELAPCLPTGWGTVRLRGVPYRDAILDITLTGAGTRIASVLVDGRPHSPVLPASISGGHTVEVALTT
jgi:hypothetical protein